MGRPAADDGGRRPKRLAADPGYLARVEQADRYQIPLSELSDWETADLDAVVGLRTFKAESCGKCGTHPSVNQPAYGGDPNALVAVWKHCRTCELIEAAQEAGPPDPDTRGWHLVVQRRDGTTTSTHKHA